MTISTYVHLFQRQCKPCHAWALTIHKFQGSETDTVVYSVSDSRNETWKHVYTAVTRGKKRVIILGQSSTPAQGCVIFFLPCIFVLSAGRYGDLEAAILRRPRKRQTTLAEKLQRKLNSVTSHKKVVEESTTLGAFDSEEEDSFEQIASQMTDDELRGKPRVVGQEEDEEKKVGTPKKRSRLLPPESNSEVALTPVAKGLKAKLNLEDSL